MVLKYIYLNTNVSELMISGPFIVNYDLKNWELIAQHSKRFPVNIRQQLLHDSLTLALSGRLCYVYAFNVSKLIEQESEPAVWKTYFSLATRLRTKFQGTPVAPKYDVGFEILISAIFIIFSVFIVIE